jgi:hypothetical protein
MGTLFTKEKGFDYDLDVVREKDVIYQINYTNDQIFELSQKIFIFDSAKITSTDLDNWEAELKKIQNMILDIETQLKKVKAIYLDKLQIKLDKMKISFSGLETKIKDKKRTFTLASYNIKDETKQLLTNFFYSSKIGYKNPPGYMSLKTQEIYVPPPAYNPEVEYVAPPAYNPNYRN